MIEAVFSYEFVIPAAAVDANGHVNNVMYVQWMQDAAVRHYEAMGGTGLHPGHRGHLGGALAH